MRNRPATRRTAPRAAPRLPRNLAGLALIPVCVALTRALAGTIRDAAPAAAELTRPSPFWGLAIGFALWLALYATTSRPVRAYVLAHELTHAFWALLHGERVGAIRVTRRGGSVQVSRRRFLVLLAPYFFPLYTLLILAAYGAFALVSDPTPYAPFWLGAIGFTWGFHFTFTISILATDQSDIREAGPLPAYATIYLFNLAGIALWIVAVSPARLTDLTARLGLEFRGWIEIARAVGGRF